MMAVGACRDQRDTGEAMPCLSSTLFRYAPHPWPWMGVSSIPEDRFMAGDLRLQHAAVEAVWPAAFDRTLKRIPKPFKRRWKGRGPNRGNVHSELLTVLGVLPKDRTAGYLNNGFQSFSFFLKPVVPTGSRRRPPSP